MVADAGNSSGEVASLRADTLSWADEVDQFARPDLDGQKVHAGEKQRVILFAQAVRMLQTYKAIKTLVQDSLNDGAAALLRCLLEQHYVFCAIHRKHAVIPY